MHSCWVLCWTCQTFGWLQVVFPSCCVQQPALCRPSYPMRGQICCGRSPASCVPACHSMTQQASSCGWLSLHLCLYVCRPSYPMPGQTCCGRSPTFWPLAGPQHDSTGQQLRLTDLAFLSVCVQALLPDAWPDMLRTLAGFLCPFRAMMQQRQQEAMAAAAAAAGPAAGGSNADVAAPLRTPRAGGQASSSPQAAGALGPARSFNRYA